MATASNSLQAAMTGSHEQRVEALRQFLGYPLKQRDPEKNLFWYLRPGTNAETADETRPVAVGFYPELNEGSDAEIKAWVASKGSEVSQHFFGWSDFTNQPVMYLLLPEAQQTGRVVLVLPSESRQWRQRQVLTYEWDSQALLTPLGRLQQGELELMQKVEDKPMFSVPLVEWAFYKPIATAKELAQELARVSRQMEQAIPAVYAVEGADGYLKTLYESFKRELLPTLKVSSDNSKDYSFADIYAQTIAYGLFTARVFSHVRDPKTDFNRQDAWDKLPETNPFLRQLFQGISEQPVDALGDELADKISEVFSILRAAKMDAILSDFRQKMNREDIVIRFYEDFLAAYKPEMREWRGVYYTPEPVVSYMVRSVDILLKEKFDKPLGLADPEVMILDPACGTGTFLLWIFQLIHQRFEENPEALTEGLEDKSWSEYVQERLLPRVFGFELLMAPYAIAHLKLSLFLQETGYRFSEGKRLGIYLTNSLDEGVKRSEVILMDEYIAEEGDKASEIKKDKPIMAIISNPPYSGISSNMSEEAMRMIDGYKMIDGQPLGERKHWLQDDYVKFIRLAQCRIEETGFGIMSFVSNHGYLDNTTFRGMRQSLINTFDEIYVLDLHGNVKKKEKAEDGSKDENVFDIQQGVAIGTLVRLMNSERTGASVNHTDLYGLRDYKYNWLLENDINSQDDLSFKPSQGFYLFTPIDYSLEDEYNQFWKITDIMPVNSTAIVTARDHFVIDFDRECLLERIAEFRDIEKSDDQVRNKFFLGKGRSAKYPDGDTRGWKLPIARRYLANDEDWDSKILNCLYRPFDVQSIYYSEQMIDWHRKNVMQHMILGENMGLIARRSMIGDAINYFFVSEFIVSDGAIRSDNKGSESLFPLYLYATTEAERKMDVSRDPNFSKSFIKEIGDGLGMSLSPGEIFYYIYAVLYSPSYRLRYAEFLKIDFPRIPLTSSSDLFKTLSGCGEALVGLHLMKSSSLETLVTQFQGDSDRTVDPGHPKYANGKVTINRQGAGFTGVPQEVWEFYIGGYQVCHKWLKDRKGRTLSDDDILHYQKIIVALQETIRIMQQIDEAIPSWPIE